MSNLITEQQVTYGRRLSDRVSFDIYLSENDIQANKEFPPTRFSDRDQRLALLEKMYYGDVSDFNVSVNRQQMPVVVNYWQDYSTRIANLLLMEEPSNVPVEPVYDFLVDMTRYGAAVAYTLDGELNAADAASFYPVSNGNGIIVAPLTSDQADTSRPDRIEIWEFPMEAVGTASRYLFEWNQDRLGRLIEDEENVGQGQLTIIPNMPRFGIWGSSKYLTIANPIIEITNRLTRNSRVLDLNGRPVPFMQMAEADAEAVYDEPTDPDWNAYDKDTIKRISEGNVDFLAREVVTLPDGVQNFEFKQPNVSGVQVSLEQIEELLDALTVLTGIPNLKGEYAPTSGESLKRQMLPLYAETSSMQNQIIQALAVLGFNVTWEHVFDTFENDQQEERPNIGLVPPTPMEAAGGQ